jgi:signal transduction histidine kinase
VDGDHPAGGFRQLSAPVPSTFVTSTTTAHGPLVVRPSPEALIDVALAAAAFAGTLALLAHGGLNVSGAGSERRSLDLLGVVLTAGSTLPLLGWRRFPLGVFEATAAASVLLVGIGYPLDLPIGPAVALYLLAASRGRAVTWTLRTTLTVLGLLVAYLAAAAADQGAFPGSELLHGGLAWAAAWFAGERTRLRRAYVTELQDRARRTEREAERERQLAAAEERARIARDLHDSAGHAISVIAVRAGAARLRHHQDPDRSFHALVEIENLARHTVDEIDQIVGSLRRDDPTNGTMAPAGLASLDTLVARQRAAGLEVTLDESGPSRPLSDAADQAAYRILQEALTNAARHGGGSAHIEVVFAGTAVELTVTNPVPALRPPRPNGGHGLIGMRERATSLGGDLDAASADGTFRVHARVPYRGHRA